MPKKLPAWAKHKIKIMDDDIALIGVCVIHPKFELKMVQWRDEYFYCDSEAMKYWEKGEEVYFFPDKHHAFDIRLKNGFSTYVEK